jgi:alkanesulfonate monooxygenase SsuD/methylene tetrahydromethanopterin reductase-like flavin-dependent oxidoreductase (luciferase family)
MVDRIAVRFAMEHDTPAAMKDYFEEHPGADRSIHHVKKKQPAGKKPAQGKSPFSDAKVERAMGKAPLESEKALKKLHRLKGRNNRGPTEGGKLRDEGQQIHKALVGQAGEVAKAIRGFLEANGDVEPESDSQAHAIETAVDHMGKLERQIAESKKESENTFLGQIVDDAEKLHASILNAASTLRALMKG